MSDGSACVGQGMLLVLPWVSSWPPGVQTLRLLKSGEASMEACLALSPPLGPLDTFHHYKVKTNKKMLGPGFPSTHVNVRDSLGFVLHGPELWSQAFQLLPPSLTTSSQTNSSWRTPHRQAHCGQGMWSGCYHRRWPNSFLRKPRAWCSRMRSGRAPHPGLLLGGTGPRGPHLEGRGAGIKPPPGGLLCLLLTLV